MKKVQKDGNQLKKNTSFKSCSLHGILRKKNKVFGSPRPGKSPKYGGTQTNKISTWLNKEDIGNKSKADSNDGESSQQDQVKSSHSLDHMEEHGNVKSIDKIRNADRLPKEDKDGYNKKKWKKLKELGELSNIKTWDKATWFTKNSVNISQHNTNMANNIGELKDIPDDSKFAKKLWHPETEHRRIKPKRRKLNGLNVTPTKENNRNRSISPRKLARNRDSATPSANTVVKCRKNIPEEFQNAVGVVHSKRSSLSSLNAIAVKQNEQEIIPLSSTQYNNNIELSANKNGDCHLGSCSEDKKLSKAVVSKKKTEGGKVSIPKRKKLKCSTDKIGDSESKTDKHASSSNKRREKELSGEFCRKKLRKQIAQRDKGTFKITPNKNCESLKNKNKTKSEHVGSVTLPHKIQDKLDSFIIKALNQSKDSKKSKFTRTDSCESCDFPSFEKLNKKSKGDRSSESFKKYGVALPSIEEILKEQKDLELYRKQIEAFQNIEHQTFELPFSVKDLEKSPQYCQTVLGCRDLSAGDITDAFKENLSYISDIFYGKQYSERHERFFKNKNKSYTLTIKDLTYSTSMIVFSYEQIEHMIELLKQEFDPEDKWTPYFFQVLLPELCLKIFMDTHEMTHDEAVKYLDTRPIVDD